jgi:hypothetical protein
MIAVHERELVDNRLYYEYEVVNGISANEELAPS